MKPTTEELRMAGAGFAGVILGHVVANATIWATEKVIKWAEARKAAKAAAISAPVTTPAPTFTAQ